MNNFRLILSADGGGDPLPFCLYWSARNQLLTEATVNCVGPAPLAASFPSERTTKVRQRRSTAGKVTKLVT